MFNSGAKSQYRGNISLLLTVSLAKASNWCSEARKRDDEARAKEPKGNQAAQMTPSLALVLTAPVLNAPSTSR